MIKEIDWVFCKELLTTLEHVMCIGEGTKRGPTLMDVLPPVKLPKDSEPTIPL